MNGWQIALLMIYLIGFMAVAAYTASTVIEEARRYNDPLMAGMGLLLAFLVGLIWPALVAVSPLIGLLWLAGKLVVR